MKKEEIKKLYLSNVSYNEYRIIDKLSKLILEKGGAIVSNWMTKQETFLIYNREKKDIDNTKIETKCQDYLSFIIDDDLYYIELDENPFFDFYICKHPINRDLKTSKNYYLGILEKEFIYSLNVDLYDNLDGVAISTIASNLFNQIKNTKYSEKYSAAERIEKYNILEKWDC